MCAAAPASCRAFNPCALALRTAARAVSHSYHAPLPPTGAHLWTVGILVQFYLLHPLLLVALRPRAPGFHRRAAAALAAAFLGGCAWRVQSAWRAEFEFPFGDLSSAEGKANVSAMLSSVYLSLPSRAPELAVGAALGLALRSHAATSWLLRR